MKKNIHAITSVIIIFTFFLTSNLKSQSFADLPFYEGFDQQWVNGDTIQDIPSKYWVNSPSSGISDWYRDDKALGEQYSPCGADGTLHSAGLDCSINSGKINNLYLCVNLSSLSGDKYLSFWYINPGNTNGLKISLSTDGGLTYGSTLVNPRVKKGWTKIIVNLGNSISQNAIIKFSVQGSKYGAVNIGIDEVTIDNKTTFTFSADTLSGFIPLPVNFNVQSLGSPLVSWKWDFNNDGIIDDNTQHPSFNYTKEGFYPVSLIASDGITIDTVVLTIKAFSYAHMPFYEGFEQTWQTRNSRNDVPSIYWNNEGFNWHREDDTTTEIRLSPSAANGTKHSARFVRSYKDEKLDLFVNLSEGSIHKYMTFWYSNKKCTKGLTVLISTDAGLSYDTLKKLGTNKGWEKIVVDFGVNMSYGSKCIIRFQTNYINNSGYIYDLGIDEIKIDHVEGDFSTLVNRGPIPFTTTFSDESKGNPSSWKWDFNNDGIVDDTTQNPTYTYTLPGKYNVKLIALKEGSSDTIIKTKFINAVSYATLPFYESFEKQWINNNSIRDLPSYFWESFSSGSKFWNREDEQTSIYKPSGKSNL
jgi:PKD repeat protein